MIPGNFLIHYHESLMNSSSKRGGERDEKGRGDGVKEGWRGGWERRDGYWSKRGREEIYGIEFLHL